MALWETTVEQITPKYFRVTQRYPKGIRVNGELDYCHYEGKFHDNERYSDEQLREILGLESDAYMRVRRQSFGMYQHEREEYLVLTEEYKHKPLTVA